MGYSSGTAPMIRHAAKRAMKMLLSRFDKSARNIMVLMKAEEHFRTCTSFIVRELERGKGASKNRPESREAWRCAPLTRFSSPRAANGVRDKERQALRMHPF